MNNAKALAILASAYNVCGPLSGEAARPDTVMGMASVTELRRLGGLYLALAHAEGKRAAFSPEEVNAAIESLA